MRGRWAAAFAATTGGIVAFVIVACSSEPSEPREYDGPHTTTCSTGTPIVDYPAYSSKPSEYRNLPECVPRCGGEAKYAGGSWGAIYTLAALPSGSCTNDREVCQMTAGSVSTCGGSTRTCNLSGFECSCVAGSWRCVTTSQGGGTCGECDASVDAPADG